MRPCCAAVGVGGQNLGQQFPFTGHHEALIFQRVVASFLNEPGDVRIVQKKFIEPGDLREHLQVGKVLRREIFLGALGCAAGAAKVVPQLPVARIASNQVCRIGLEQILQRETTLVGSQVFCRFGGNLKERVASRAGHVVLYLRDQRRDKIEGLVNVGKLVQQFDHAVVVLERMQPHPGQPVLAGDQVLVKRLMLVPQNYDAQNGHEREISKSKLAV